MVILSRFFQFHRNLGKIDDLYMTGEFNVFLLFCRPPMQKDVKEAKEQQIIAKVKYVLIYYC